MASKSQNPFRPSGQGKPPIRNQSVAGVALDCYPPLVGLRCPIADIVSVGNGPALVCSPRRPNPASPHLPSRPPALPSGHPPVRRSCRSSSATSTMDELRRRAGRGPSRVSWRNLGSVIDHRIRGLKNCAGRPIILIEWDHLPRAATNNIGLRPASHRFRNCNRRRKRPCRTRHRKGLRKPIVNGRLPFAIAALLVTVVATASFFCAEC